MSYTGRAPATWQDVAETARSRGAEDFCRALAELPAQELDQAWQRKRRPRNVGRGKRSRHQYIDQALARWRQETVSTAWTAAAVRWALSLPKPAPRPDGRPAFQPGNQLALVHGGHSERAIAERMPEAVQRIRDLLAEEVGTSHPVDEILLRRTARCLVQVEQYDAYLDVEGVLDENGRPRAAESARLARENLLVRLLGTLGATPMARARLHADKAQAGRDVLAIQRRLREQYGSGA